MLAVSVMTAVPYREAKRRRLTVDQTVEARRCRLKSALHAAATSALAPGGGCWGPGSPSVLSAAEAVANLADEHRRQELAFDEGLSPALEFLNVMGTLPGVVFRDILRELGQQLCKKMRGSPREALERLLSDMLQHVGVPYIRDFVAGALQCLADTSPPGDLERQAISALADAFMKDKAAQFHQLPPMLQRRIWEIQPQLFRDKIRPLIAEFVYSLRRSFGSLLIELRQKSPEQRRRESSPLQQLADLVGQQAGLYRIIKAELVGLFQQAARTGAPAVRLSRLGNSSTNSDDEGDCRPVSLGPEPLLSTLRSQLLLALCDSHVLQESMIGTWEVTAECGAQTYTYCMTVLQRGNLLSGSSTMDGGSTLEGSIKDRKLVFKQQGPTKTVVCNCEVAASKRELNTGVWHEEARSDERSPSMQRSQGTFKARRVGPMKYADDSGEVWDDMCALIIVMDKIHQRKAALDSSLLPAIQQAAQQYAETAGTGTSRSSVEADIGFVLIDPCLVQSILRGLLAIKSDPRQGGIVLCPEARAALQLLVCATHSVLSQQNLTTDGNEIKQSLVPKSLAVLQLSCGPPSSEVLASVGLPEKLLMIALRKHGQKDVDALVQSGGQINAELAEVLRGAARGPVHTVVRLLLGTLTNKCLLFRNQLGLEDCLRLMQEHNPRNGRDWVQLQQVDMLVGAAIHLSNWLDVGLRKTLREYTFPLAREDPWVHGRVADLLAMFQRPNFASTREEITALQEMLNHGSFCDEHHKWWCDLALAYLPLVQAQGKGYLLDIYRDSTLGRQVPLDDGRLGSLVSLAAAAIPPPANVATSPMHALSPAPTSDAVETMPCAGSLTDRARQILSSDDGLLVPGVGERIREFCAECTGAERVNEVVELLTVNFRGYHWLSHLASRWLATISSRISTVEDPIRSILRQRMIDEFSPQRADPLLMPRSGTPHIPAWLDPFIQEAEWRGVVYELAKQHRGQASSFLSALLLQISEAENYKDELLSNTSSTSNFIVFCRTLRSELTRFFALLNTDESLVAPTVADICKICCFSEYTYIYAQAVFHHLMHIRPRERHQVQQLSQALTDAAADRSGHIPQLDLRFTSAGQYPEIFGILYSMCRLGRDIRVVPADVVRLCGLVEGLLEWKVPSPIQRQGCESSPADGGMRDGCEVAGVDMAAPGSDHGTEVMSDVGSWLEPEETEEKDAWVGVGSNASEDELEDEDAEDAEGRSRRVYASATSSSAAQGKTSVGDGAGRPPQQPATEQSERTASIFHMPAVSSAASGAQVLRDSQATDAGGGTAGMSGVLEALRSPAILEALLARFIDHHVLSGRECRAFARLLAILTVDGLWVTDASVAERQEAAKEATVVATKVAKELERIYSVLHKIQQSWLKRLAAMAYIKCHAVTSMALLRWLTQVFLSRQATPGELRVRMSQSLLFVLLRRACDSHPLQIKSVLDVLRHILELLPYAESNDDDNEEGLTGDALDGQAGQEPAAQRLHVRHMIVTMLTYLIVAHGASILVFDFASSTMASWDKALVQLFISEIFASVEPPFSCQFAWSAARWLALSSALTALEEVPQEHAEVHRFCEACRVPETFASPEAVCVDMLTQRQADLSTAVQKIEARLKELKETTVAQLTVVRHSQTTSATGGGYTNVDKVASAGNVASPATVEEEEEAKHEEAKQSYAEQAKLWDWWSSSETKKNLPQMKKSRTDRGRAFQSSGKNDGQIGKNLRKQCPKSGQKSNSAISSEENPDTQQQQHHQQQQAPHVSQGVTRLPQSCLIHNMDKGAGVEPSANGVGSETDSVRLETEEEEDQRPPKLLNSTMFSSNVEAANSTPAPKRRLCLRIGSTNASIGTDSCYAQGPLPSPSPMSVPDAAGPCRSPWIQGSQAAQTTTCSVMASDFELDLRVLQGRWSNSIPGMGILTVKGDNVTFEKGHKYTLTVLSGGVVEMSGWKTLREKSSCNEVVWENSAFQTCAWRRLSSIDQGSCKVMSRGRRQRG